MGLWVPIGLAPTMKAQQAIVAILCQERQTCVGLPSSEQLQETIEKMKTNGKDT
jgi:hypothetical protein